MTRYQMYVAMKTDEYGSRFDNSDLAEQFISHYNFGQSRRIKVLFPWGEIVWGYVGITTGWKPAFLLMRRVGQYGSSLLLNKDCKILAQKEM